MFFGFAKKAARRSRLENHAYMKHPLGLKWNLTIAPYGEQSPEASVHFGGVSKHVRQWQVSTNGSEKFETSSNISVSGVYCLHVTHLSKTKRQGCREGTRITSSYTNTHTQIVQDDQESEVRQNPRDKRLASIRRPDGVLIEEQIPVGEAIHVLHVHEKTRNKGRKIMSQ